MDNPKIHVRQTLGFIATIYVVSRAQHYLDYHPHVRDQIGGNKFLALGLAVAAAVLALIAFAHKAPVIGPLVCLIVGGIVALNWSDVADKITVRGVWYLIGGLLVLALLWTVTVLRIKPATASSGSTRRTSTPRWLPTITFGRRSRSATTA